MNPASAARTGRSRWPVGSDVDAWAALANRALQLETLETDLAENERWAETMRELVARGLPYDEFITVRMEALRARLRRRKLDQTNLRYKYGIKARPLGLVRYDVKRYLRHRQD